MWENEEKDGAQVKRQTAEDYEYSTLMQLLGVSVSKHLLDEHFTLIWANDFYYQLIGWPKEEYEKVFHNRPDLYYANDREEWKRITEVVMETMRRGEKGYKLATRMRRKMESISGFSSLSGLPMNMWTVIR